MTDTTTLLVALRYWGDPKLSCAWREAAFAEELDFLPHALAKLDGDLAAPVTLAGLNSLPLTAECAPLLPGMWEGRLPGIGRVTIMEQLDGSLTVSLLPTDPDQFEIEQAEDMRVPA